MTAPFAKRRGPALPGAALLAVILLACGAGAGTAADRGPVRSMLEMRQQAVVVQEWDLSCGAAALATILTYHLDDPVSEREVVAGLIRRAEYLQDPELVRRRHGFSLLDMKRYVEARGYRGIGLGNLSIEAVRAIAPVIVPITTRGSSHFVVFRGMAGDRVLLADPSFGNRTMARETFEALWQQVPRHGRIGFRVVRPDGGGGTGGLDPQAGARLWPDAAAVRAAIPF